jgi:hypothetical protein
MRAKPRLQHPETGPAQFRLYMASTLSSAVFLPALSSFFDIDPDQRSLPFGMTMEPRLSGGSLTIWRCGSCVSYAT